MGINGLTHLYPLPILPNPNPPKSPILTPLIIMHAFICFFFVPFFFGGDREGLGQRSKLLKCFFIVNNVEQSMPLLNLIRSLVPMMCF